jgi:hypothetical protein
MRHTGEALGLDERAERQLLGHQAFDDVTDLVPTRKSCQLKGVTPSGYEWLSALLATEAGLSPARVINQRPGIRSVHGASPTRQSQADRSR